MFSQHHPIRETAAAPWLSGFRRRLALAVALLSGLVLGILLAGTPEPPGPPPAHLALAPGAPPTPGAPLPSAAPLDQPLSAPSAVPPSSAQSAARQPPSADSSTQPRPPSATPTAPSVVVPLEAPPIASAPSRPPPTSPVAPPRSAPATEGQSAALPPAVERPPRGEPGGETVRPGAPRRVSGNELPAWRRNAAPAPAVADRPMIALVIDDVGLDQRRSAEVVKLPGPVTLSYLPYGRDLPRQTAEARAQGHELLVHIPMEPLNGKIDPGPNALTTDLPADEIRRRLDKALAAFDGYVGINNHMGSRFTSETPGMEVVMDELKRRGLLFLDSRTVQHSVGATVAAAHGVPHAGRHFFIDNDLTIADVNRELADTERLARQSGFAVAIGHPHDVTIAALKAWLPTLEEKGFVLVPVSAIVEHLEARRGTSQQSAAPRDATPARSERSAP